MSDQEAIQDLVQVYFDSMFESSADHVNRAFHDDAKITGYIEGELHTMSKSDFAGFVASHQPSAKENGETPKWEIVSLEVNGATAITKVRCDYLGLTFLDSLSMLKVDDSWSIYNKLFHVEGPAQ